MRILLAAKHAPEGRQPIGGVQSWCRTVAAELRKRGYEAVTWGPEQVVPLGGFDVGIIANAIDANRALDLCGSVIGVSHGIIPAERPILENTAYTSEEVRDHWMGTGPVIRQPIDTDFWSPENNTALFLTRFSYRRGLPYVKQMARSLKCKYRHVRSQTPEEARGIIRQSAAVLATGRAALESAATGTVTVLCDHRSAYMGPMLDTDFQGAMVRNYSGRGGIAPTPENVRQAIIEAQVKGSMRDHVLKHHKAAHVVDQLLELL